MLQPPAQTLLELLKERAGLAPRQAAFFWDDQPFSFEWLWRGVNRFASELQWRGVGGGARVLICLPNGPDFFLAFYGTQRAGAIPVPLFPASGQARIAAIAELCGAEFLVVPTSAPEDFAGLRTVSVPGSEDSPPHGSFPDVGPDDIAFLQYTSGSTGTPKGVMLSHRGLLTNAEQMIAGMELSAADCFVSWLPVYHDMGLILMTMVPFFLGAKLVLLPAAAANARPWLGAIARHRGTITAAPDFAYRLALRSVRDPGAYDLSSLRVALDAAEPVRPGTLAAFERCFGLRNVLIAGYGLAEATVGVSTWAPGSPPLVDGRGVVSVGHPFAGIDVRIIEERPAAWARADWGDRSPQPGEHRRLFWRSGGDGSPLLERWLHSDRRPRVPG